MGVYLEKRTGKYYIQFQHNGLTYKKTCSEETSKSDAINYERNWRNDLFLQEMGLKKDSAQNEILFQDFYTKYFRPYVKQNTPASYDNMTIVFTEAIKHFKDKTVREIKPFEIEQFKQLRASTPTTHKRTRKPSTVIRELSVLSKFFSLAVTNDFADYNPCSRVVKPKFNNISDKVLKPEDEKKFFNAFRSDWAKDICRFVLQTGLRQNDVLGLKPEQVKVSEKILILSQRKTMRRVVIPLNKAAMVIINRWLKKGASVVFPSPKGKGQGTSVRKACTNASERAKIERITIRDLRRTFATRLSENQVPTLDIAQLLGHSDLRMVMRYGRGKANLRSAVDSLEVYEKSTKKKKPKL